MNAIDLLTQQHREVERLFGEVQQNDGVDRSEKLDEIADALTIHTAIEERIFYPGVKRPQTEDLLKRSVEEHLEVKRILASMLDRDAEDDDSIFNGPLQNLIKDVKDHVEEEEQQLFPAVRTFLGTDELDALGDQMTKMTQELAGEEDVSEHIYEETGAPAQI
jgi:hemerythrin superfamily protein